MVMEKAWNSLFNLIRPNPEELVFDRPWEKLKLHQKSRACLRKKDVATATERGRESYWTPRRWKQVQDTKPPNIGQDFQNDWINTLTLLISSSPTLVLASVIAKFDVNNGRSDFQQADNSGTTLWWHQYPNRNVAPFDLCTSFLPAQPALRRSLCSDRPLGQSFTVIPLSADLWNLAV